MSHPPDGAHLTAEASRALDRLAVERFGIPSIVLMENAARSAAEAILGRYPDARHALIFCGPGNNGGDGLALARHLHNSRSGAGLKAECLLTSEPKTDDAKTNLAIVRAMGLPVLDPHDPIESHADTLLIDAMLGTGAEPPLRPPFDGLVEQINARTDEQRPLAVVALDLPTGLYADGPNTPDAQAVRADLTIAFAAPKPVHTEAGAQAFIGEVAVAPIGAPAELLESLLSSPETGAHPGDTARPQRTKPDSSRPIPGRGIDAQPRS